MYEKALLESLFCQSQPIAFLPFLMPWPLSLLKLPTNFSTKAKGAVRCGKSGNSFPEY